MTEMQINAKTPVAHLLFLLIFSVGGCGSNSDFSSEYYISDLNVCTPDSRAPVSDGIDYSSENYQTLYSGEKIAQKVEPLENVELWGVRIRLKAAAEFSLGVRLKLVESTRLLKQPSDSRVSGVDDKILYAPNVSTDAAWIEWQFSNIANLEKGKTYWILLEPVETVSSNATFVLWGYNDLKATNYEYSLFVKQLGTWAIFSRTTSHQLIGCKKRENQ